MSKSKDSLQEEIAAAWQNKDLPHLYFNGFLYTPGSGDVSLILKLNGRPVAVANAPVEIARELSQGLLSLCAFIDQQARERNEALARSVMGDNGQPDQPEPAHAS